MKAVAVCATLIVLAVALSAGAVIEDKSGSPGPSNTGSPAEATGGPDDYGYVFADNAEAPCAGTYAYVDITTTGAATGLVGVDDGHAGPFPMGFSFDFYGTGYTEFYVGSNGVIFFVDVYLGLGNACPLPATQGSYGVHTFIAPVPRRPGGPGQRGRLLSDVRVLSGRCRRRPVHGHPVLQRLRLRLDRRQHGLRGRAVRQRDDHHAVPPAFKRRHQPEQRCVGDGGIQGTDASPPVHAIEYSCNSQSLSPDLAVVFAPPTAQTSGIPNECVVPVDLMSFTAE